MERGRRFAAVAFAAVVLAALVVLVAGGEDDPSIAGDAAVPSGPGAEDDAVVRDTGDGTGDSPFSTRAGAEVAGASSSVAGDAVSDRTSAKPRASGPSPDVTPTAGAIDVTTLGRQALDEAAFDALAARLADDPELLAALIAEFRAERDPARLKRLVRLLGEAGGPAATALAAEYVYASDDALRDIGLDLLRRVQPGNGEARDIVSGLLSNGTTRETLVPVLQTLTRPGVVPAEERTRLAGQVGLLATHEDPGVRRLGLDVLSRWSSGTENVALMRDGLADTHPGVREAAAYALVGRPDADGTLAGELFAVADDADEEEGVRRAAILALKNLPLAPDALERRIAIERVLDRRPLR